jgi:hypothetical protein
MAMLLLAALGTMLAPAVAPMPSPRTVMVWLNEWTGPPGPAATWEARLADIAAHATNLTHVSPCIHEFTAAGTFGNQDGKAQGSYADIAPHLPSLQQMGLKIVPIIYNVGGLSAQGRLHDGSAPVFIKTAVAKAVAAGYSGYNVDNELRGGASEKSWGYLKGYGGHWLGFLNEFADAMHAVNKTLSVDIAGCCGWADTAHPDSPLGHCAGAFAAHEFLYTSCEDYASSRLDFVYGMSSYNAPLNGPPWVLAGKDKAGHNFSYSLDGPAFLKTFANHTMAKLGGPTKYGLGFKGGWPYSSNYSDPAATVWDAKARSTLDFLTGTLGIRHAARWHNEPRSQAEWDAWGYWLHGGRQH